MVAKSPDDNTIARDRPPAQQQNSPTRRTIAPDPIEVKGSRTVARGCDPEVLAKVRRDVFDVEPPKP